VEHAGFINGAVLETISFDHFSEGWLC